MAMFFAFGRVDVAVSGEKPLQERVWMRLSGGKAPAGKGVDETVDRWKVPCRKGHG